MYFLPGSSVFIVDFKHLNDGWECCVCILTIQVHFSNTILTIQIAYTSGHQWFRKPNKDAFVFIVAFQSISKSATNQFRESLRKNFP